MEILSVTRQSSYLRPGQSEPAGVTGLTGVHTSPLKQLREGLSCMYSLRGVPVVVWAVVFLILITILNLVHVGGFAFVESTLALVKILHNVAFCIVAFLIVIGLAGTGHAIGWSVLIPPGFTWKDAIFPAGFVILLANLALIFVNFQGSEIVGLAAAETQNPQKVVPRACRNVVYRILRVDIIPILLLVMILPYSEAGLQDSVFSMALSKYGFTEVAGILSFIVLTAAFSCANSGFYGAVRALYGLSLEGMAPKNILETEQTVHSPVCHALHAPDLLGCPGSVVVL